MAPTGVHIRDPRQQLIDAAGRVLSAGGGSALTSRSVTDEAGVSKGVLHRHFADFDDLLVELVRQRAGRITGIGMSLRTRAGSGEVAVNVAEALADMIDPSTASLVAVVLFREGLRARLDQSAQRGAPALVREAVDGIAGYLTEERALGRIAADAEPSALATALVGACVIEAAGDAEQPSVGSVRGVVDTVLADVLQRRLL